MESAAKYLPQVIAIMKKDFFDLVRMAMEEAVNDKTGTASLVGSSIWKQLEAAGKLDGDSIVVSLMLNQYVRYIESGRRKGAAFPPPEPIIRWMRKHHIPTDNSTVFLIRRAISRDGIKPRPFMEKAMQAIDEAMTDPGGYMDILFDELTRIIDEFFNS